MFKKEDVLSFFARITSILKPNGIFVIRTIIRRKKQYLYDPQQIVAHYRANNSLYNFYAATHYPFLHAAYNLKRDFVKVSDAYALVEEMQKEGLITDGELKEWALRGKGITLQMYLPTMEWLNSYLHDIGLTMEHRWEGNEPYSKFVPISFARKK